MNDFISLGRHSFFHNSIFNWNYGIEKKNGFYITSIPRTIVECLAYKNTITGFEGIYALRKAIRGGLVNLTEVWEMADHLGYSKRIGKTLEAYLDEGA